METSTFWHLVKKLQPKIEEGIERLRHQHRLRRYRRLQYCGHIWYGRKINGPNGIIPYSTRVAAAIRYMSGGDPKDIQLVFGISNSEVYKSVWLVVDAINETTEFDIVYPSSHEEQREIARGFQSVSEAKFDNCGGNIDGMLIWTERPSKQEFVFHQGRQTAFYCGRKHKWGLNMQGVCDAQKRFLDVTIQEPASASDYMAYITSPFGNKIETEGFLAPGICLYGDAAYANSNTMAIPFKGVSDGPRDAYNFFQSQVRINIECTFGILVQRFGLLRRAIQSRVTISKVRSLVQSMCKIHNLCIDRDGVKVPSATGLDEAHIVGLDGVDIDSLTGNVISDDHGRKGLHNNANTMPRELMLSIVNDSALTRRCPRKWRNTISKQK